MQWRELKLSYQDRLKLLATQGAYELLGVERGTSLAEVRQAYLRKVRAYHPDASDPFIKSYGQEVVKLLNRAYEEICKELSDRA